MAIRFNPVPSSPKPVASSIPAGKPKEKVLKPKPTVEPETPAKSSRGRPRKEGGPATIAVTIRIDPDMMAALQALGPEWRAHAKALLRKALKLSVVS